MSEIEQFSRKFTVTVNEEEVELQFRRPHQIELFEIDKQYRIIYAEALRSKVMTEVEARRLFEEQGTWTEEHDKDIRNTAAKIAQLEVVLQNSDVKDPDSLTLAANINMIRAQMMAKIGDKQELFSNTAEGIANEQKMHKFIELCCLKTEDGTPFFEGFEQYKNFVATDMDAMSVIHKEGYFFEYRLPEDIAKDWAEIEFAERIGEAAKEEAEKAKKKKASEARAAKKKTAKRKTKKKATKRKTKKKAKKVGTKK